MSTRIALLLALAGCSDAEIAGVQAWGNPASVTCYSGGVTVYDGRSTGAVQTEANSDGWQFQEAGSGDFVRVSGTCVVRNDRGGGL